MNFDSNRFEYRSPKELEGDKAHYIFVPMSLITDSELNNNRVALFAYLSIYRGLNSKVLFSVPKFIEWAGFKSNTHTGGINDKVLETLDMMNDIGYLAYCDEPSRSSLFEIKMDMQYITEACENNFAILYIDEIEKIMAFKREMGKTSHLNSFSVSLVFAYLRRKIFRRPNELNPEEQTTDGIKSRRERCPEAYACEYKSIGTDLGLKPRVVSKSAKILERLELLVVEEAYHFKTDDGEYRTPYTMFANYEKREGRYLLDYGANYAHREMELREKDIASHMKRQPYTLKKSWKIA